MASLGIPDEDFFMSDIYKKVNKATKEALKESMKPWAKKIKAAYEENYKEAIEEFKSYTNEGWSDLYDLFDIHIGGIGDEYVTMDINIEEQLIKPSWHYDKAKHQFVYGAPEDMFYPVFMEGFHGGRGESHTLWGFRTAAQTTPPNDLFDQKIEEYKKSQVNEEFQEIITPIIKRKLSAIGLM